MLQLRNTPDPDCKLSPAQIVFGRPLRDAFSFVNRCVKFENKLINPLWKDAWKVKEEALRARFVKSVETLGAHTRSLPLLEMGDRVFVQNQSGPHPNKWDRSGIVVDLKGNDQYLIKVDGTGRLTLRNRRFLRKYTLPESSHYGKSGLAINLAETKLPVHAVPTGQMPETQMPVISSPSDMTEFSLPSGNDTESCRDEQLQNMCSKPPPIDVPLPSPDSSDVMQPLDGLSIVQPARDFELNTSSEVTAARHPKRVRSAPRKYVPETGTWN